MPASSRRDYARRRRLAGLSGRTCPTPAQSGGCLANGQLSSVRDGVTSLFRVSRLHLEAYCVSGLVVNDAKGVKSWPCMRLTAQHLVNALVELRSFRESRRATVLREDLIRALLPWDHVLV